MLKTNEVDSLVRADPLAAQQFVGVFALDKIPDFTNIQHPQSLVFNTDPHCCPGQHWVAIHLDPVTRTSEYFDSYGILPIYRQAMQTLSSISPTRINFNAETLQELDSTLCGHYCVVYLWEKARGTPLSRWLENFSQDDSLNDQGIELLLANHLANQKRPDLLPIAMV